MSLYTSDQGNDPNRNGAVLCVGGRMDGWGVWEIYWLLASQGGTARAKPPKPRCSVVEAPNTTYFDT